MDRYINRSTRRNSTVAADSGDRSRNRSRSPFTNENILSVVEDCNVQSDGLSDDDKKMIDAAVKETLVIGDALYTVINDIVNKKVAPMKEDADKMKEDADKMKEDADKMKKQMEEMIRRITDLEKNTSAKCAACKQVATVDMNFLCHYCIKEKVNSVLNTMNSTVNECFNFPPTPEQEPENY